jgi:hypothetical protein
MTEPPWLPVAPKTVRSFDIVVVRQVLRTLVFPKGACCKDLKGTMWCNDASLMAISTVLIS